MHLFGRFDILLRGKCRRPHIHRLSSPPVATDGFELQTSRWQGKVWVVSGSYGMEWD